MNIRPMRLLIVGWAALFLPPASAFGPGAAKSGELRAAVEVEETIYTYTPADNGAGPLWCYGSTCIARIGRDVVASGLETIPGARPLNNVRWRLYRRGEAGWTLMQQDELGRTREPCPLVVFPSGRVFLSTNPTKAPLDAYSGPARPEVLELAISGLRKPGRALEPAWEGAPAFTEHSYRGMCADGKGRELLLFNVQGYDGYHWSFLNREERWAARGFLRFPPGTEYEKPEPIRMCYPILALRNRSAHALLVSDIVEPVKEWREFKRKLTGREWDYDFRRLFYTWTRDLTREPFHAPLEVASRDKTAGHITNLDLWLDDKGRSHLLWLERSVWYPQMRDRFFPGTPLTTSLEYAIVDRGRVTERATLMKGGEGAPAEQPGFARFHASPGGQLFVLAYVSGADPAGKPVSENRLLEIRPAGQIGRAVRIPFDHPFTNFMTSCERGGSAPSDLIDVLGESTGRPGISYGRIRIRH